MQNIGYLIPEFPGQTHNFFWREMQAMRELGFEVELFSTRRPPRTIESPSWAAEARERTHYLFPTTGKDALRGMGLLVLSPLKTLRCLAVVARADLPIRGKIRAVALVFMGAVLASKALLRNIGHIHVHSCADAANIAMFASLLSETKYSLTLHNPVSEYGPNQAAKWKYASFGIVIAKWILADLKSRYGASLPPVAIAPMGVDLDRFRRAAPYQPHVPGQKLELFCCARLNRAKGFLDLLDATSQLASLGYDVNLSIAGEDDVGGTGFRKEVERKIQENGLSERVVLLGAVPESVVIRHLERAHVFVLASLEEPLGVAIMEAMALEVPVVVTRSGGVPELVADGEHGILVDPRRPDQLASAVASIAANPSAAREMGRQGRERIESSFGHRCSAKAIASFLNGTGIEVAERAPAKENASVARTN